MKKAGKGNRTPLSSLGSWHSTDELYLQTMLLYTSKTEKSIVNFIFFVQAPDGIGNSGAGTDRKRGNSYNVYNHMKIKICYDKA